MMTNEREELGVHLYRFGLLGLGKRCNFFWECRRGGVYKAYWKLRAIVILRHACTFVFWERGLVVFGVK